MTHTEEVRAHARIELFHIVKGESIPDNTTTSGRKIYGPSSILRIWHEDGSCQTRMFDYEPQKSIADYVGAAR